MSEFSFMRSLFLIFLFPHIISLGRRWTSGKPPSQDSPACPENGSALAPPDELPTSPGEFDVAPGDQSETEPMMPPPRSDDAAHDSSLYVFDLVFLRWSLVVDGAFTMIAAFATKSWHIYLGMFPPASPLLAVCRRYR